MKDINDIENKSIVKKKKNFNNKNNKIDVSKLKKTRNDEKNEMKINEKCSNSFNLIEVIIIMIITSVFGILIGSCVTYFKYNVVDNNNSYQFDEFLNVYNELVDEYYTDINKDELIEAGIKGMIDYLGDPYSSYLNSDETNSLNEELEGEFVGIGVSITTSINNEIYIVEVFEDGPAEKAGFKVGDIIKKVDGKSVDEEGAENISSYIRGKAGTEVDIEILRDSESITLTAVRGVVEISSVSHHVISNSEIGYIGISVFADNTPKQFKDAMDDLIKLGVESVIIDLRNNYGGYLSSSEDIASMFLDKDDVIYQLDTKGKIDKVLDKKESIYEINAVVLINGSSASASEILAASLSENLDYKLVGEKSYGKGTVQKAKSLSSGAMIKYTVQEWYTPKGNVVNEVGLMPDYEVVLDKDYYLNPSEENDNQLQKAIEILKK